MKVILYMAMTVNGLIARENYQEDFLSHENWKVFLKLADKYGCLIMGRKTCQIIQQWKDYNFDKVKATKIIVSHNPKLKLPAGYLMASSSSEALQKASQRGFHRVLLAGGSILNSAFLKERLIDEIIVNIEPYVLGKGIGIFAESNLERKLKLIGIIRLKSGIIQLHYKVQSRYKVRR